MTTKHDYQKLLEEIRKHDRHYYVENKPAISDYEYDQLYKKLEKMEAEHPDWVIPSSPTQRVGDPLRKGFKQQAHESPMMSLANTYSQEEVEDFMGRVHKLLEKRDVALCAELKMDGVAVSVRYEKGIYTRALTRGDGEKGDDITANMKTIHAVPLELSGTHIPDVLEVRGEVFMPMRRFRSKIKKKKKREKRSGPIPAMPRPAR